MDSQEPRRTTPLTGFRTLKNATFLRAFRATSARRAFEEIEKDRRGWLRHGIAALAISALGLGVAGAVAMTGSASQASDGAAPGVTVASSQAAQDGTGEPMFGNRGEGTSRTMQRQSLTSDQAGQNAPGEPMDGTVDMSARRDAQKNAEVTDTSSEDADASKAAERRAKALASSSAETEKLSEKLSREERERRLAKIRAAEEAARQAQQNGTSSGTTDTGSTGGSGSTELPEDSDIEAAPGDGKATYPLKSYSIAARFGQVGSWSRYHTGVDFSAPIGTPIYATGNGTVTNAGSGSASGWAGNYVTIKFSDGRQMLFAHMGSVSVSVGQQVSGGQLIGHVGMTGRTFGPHCHVELYPAGVTPGDVYRAVDPMPWFAAHGVN